MATCAEFMVIAWAPETTVELPLTETEPAEPAAAVDMVRAAPVNACEPVKLMAATVALLAVRVIGAPADIEPPPDMVMVGAALVNAPVDVIVPLLVSAEKVPVTEATLIAPDDPIVSVGD